MGVCINRKNEESEDNENEKFEGKRLNCFTCSGKEVLSINKYYKKVQDEIRQVKEISDGKTSGWIVSSRPEGEIY